MPKIDLDVNFPILIIILSILLIAIVEGGRINELIYHQNGEIGRVFFSFVFLVGGMLVIFGLLTAPSAYKEVSYVTMTIGVMIILANILSFVVEGRPDQFALSEVICGFLIISGGFLLKIANKNLFD